MLLNQFTKLQTSDGKDLPLPTLNLYLKSSLGINGLEYKAEYSFKEISRLDKEIKKLQNAPKQTVVKTTEVIKPQYQDISDCVRRSEIQGIVKSLCSKEEFSKQVSDLVESINTVRSEPYGKQIIEDKLSGLKNEILKYVTDNKPTIIDYNPQIQSIENKFKDLETKYTDCINVLNSIPTKDSIVNDIKSLIPIVPDYTKRFQDIAVSVNAVYEYVDKEIKELDDKITQLDKDFKNTPKNVTYVGGVGAGGGVVNSVVAGTNITVDSTDPANPIVTWSGDTDGVPEGSNLYFTDERAQDAVGTILTDSNTIDFTYNDGANTITADVITNAATSEILYKTATGIDGAAFADIDSNGVLNLLDDPTLSTPTNGILLGSTSKVGRRYANIKEVLEDEYRLQPFMGDKVVRYWVPNGAATTTQYNNGITLAFTGSGGSAALGTGSYFATRNRLANNTGASANSSAAGRHNGLIVFRGNSAGRGGFHFVAECGRADAVLVTDARWIMSLYGTNSAISGVEPSTLLQVLGFGRDSTDTNLQIMHNDGSGTCTKVDLGANFPANTKDTDWYRGEFYCPPNGSTVYYLVTRMNTSDQALGSLTTNLPTNTNFLAPQGYINNTATAAAATLHYGRMYLECFN